MSSICLIFGEKGFGGTHYFYSGKKIEHLITSCGLDSNSDIKTNNITKNILGSRNEFFSKKNAERYKKQQFKYGLLFLFALHISICLLFIIVESIIWYNSFYLPLNYFEYSFIVISKIGLIPLILIGFILVLMCYIIVIYMMIAFYSACSIEVSIKYLLIKFRKDCRDNGIENLSDSE